MSFPRYPEYKDSGVEWLGTVPVHWDLVPLKQMISRIESGTSVNAIDTPAGDGELGVLKTSCVYHGHFDADENKAVIPDEYDRVACPVTAGTLVVSRMNTPDLVGAAGVVHVSHENLFLPDRLWQVHFDGADPNFVHHWTHTPAYRAQVEMACAGTSSSMQNLGQDQFRCFVIPRPSYSEQTAIATFLDRETAKIDALVAEQEKLIALLQEKRQAVISHAVTKGLDPSVPMKDSGVEWLGKVPEHWEVKRLKYLGDAFIGLTYDPQDVTDSESGTLVLRSSNVQGGQIFYDDNVYVGMKIPEKAITQEGDILICSRNGSRALIGKNALIDQQSAGVAFGAFMTVFRSPFNSYLKWVLNSQLFEFQSGAFLTSTINQLTVSNLYGFEIPLPPESNRKEISAFLDTATRRIDVLVAEACTAITLLQERRTALTSAAVTGQIDVRGLVGSANAPVSIAASAHPESA